MTNPTGPVRWLYIYLLNSVHGDVLLDMHDSLFKSIHTYHILPNKVAAQRGVSMTHTQMGNGVFYGLTLPYNAELANGIFYNVCSHTLNLDLEGV